MKSYRRFICICLIILSAICLPGSAISKELVIVGTGAGMPVLNAVGKAFTRVRPDVDVIVPPSIGSGGGIKAVGRDEYLVGRVARNISANEKKYGLVQTPLAKLPIVFYTHISVTLDSITPEQVCDIYSGAVRTWEALDGGKGPIRVIRREEGDSSLKVLLSTLPGFAGITRTRISKITYTDQETVDTCLHRKNSIAYGTLADVKGLPGIPVLKFKGISAAESGYPCLGPFDLVYKEKHFRGTLRQFVEFLSSDAAKAAIIDAGGVPADRP